MRNKPIRLDRVKKRRFAFFTVKTLVQLAILAVIAATAIIASTGAMYNIAAAEEELAAVEMQIEAAKARQREIADSVAYVQSIGFIENIARNWLRLVRPDEILFIMVD